MCGFFALFYNRPLNKSDIDFARVGTSSLAHRGPDGQGEWIDAEKGVYLGHRRLAIIDLSSASDQPFISNGHAVAYNGEIYNFRDLRTNLMSKGHKFTSTGDTEVLLKSWQQHGEGALDQLEGMFSFALWDGNCGYLAVDPFGEKPLYWTQTIDGIVVSSELATLVKYLPLEADLQEHKVAAFMALGQFPAPETAYKNTWRLPPATVLKIHAGSTVQERRYWTAPIGTPGRGAPVPLDEKELDSIRDLLTSNLERRLISDVPISLFLSGGVDSSLIASLITQELGQELNAITVSFSDASVLDEAPIAAKIAEYLNLNHSVINSATDELDANPESLLSVFGQPSDRMTTFSVRQISGAVKGHCKVALTGMGGDELTAGYNKYCHYYHRRFLFDLPEFTREILNEGLRQPARLNNRLERFRVQYLNPDRNSYLAIKNFPAIEWLSSIQGFNDWSERHYGSKSRPRYLEVIDQELNQIMADEHLLMYDLASMQESLELRTPFLCRNLAVKMAGYDPRALVAFGQKSVLRRLLDRYLPKSLTETPKAGFTYPPERFLNEYGDDCPYSSALPAKSIKYAWDKRNSDYGWQRIGVRLLMLNLFEKQSGQ
jgi:asparagine synthase (glutamine-hydrolysing)